MKSFWKLVEVAPFEGGYAILLDSKPIKTPGGTSLVVPSADLAEAIAEEWRQAGVTGKEIDPDDLPFTRLTATAQTRVPAARDDIVRQLAAYGLNDLLCYRADSPPSLAAREHALWQPWLDWALTEYGVQLVVGTGVLPVNQPAGTAEIFAEALNALDAWHLAVLGVTVPAMGSLVLGLALAAGALDAQAAFELAMLDELFQAGRWGRDAEAEHRRTRIRADLLICERFLKLAA